MVPAAPHGRQVDILNLDIQDSRDQGPASAEGGQGRPALGVGLSSPGKTFQSVKWYEL